MNNQNLKLIYVSQVNSFFKIIFLGVVCIFSWAENFEDKNVKTHLHNLAGSPRPVGSPGHAAAEAYLHGQLTQLGVPFEIQQTYISEKSRTGILVANIKNFCVRLEGSENKNTIVFSAHYDSVANSPGAGDNAVAVAVLLEALRVASTMKLRNTLVFLFVDAEELQLLGAKAFVERHSWAKEVDLVFNFEGRGTAGHAYAFETTRQNLELMKQMKEALPWMKGASLGSDLYAFLPNTTDFREYKRIQRVQGVGFAHIGGPANYHGPGDHVQAVSNRTLKDHGRNAMGLVAYFGVNELREGRPQEAVFFHLPWGGVVYSQTWNRPLLYLCFFLVVAAHGVAVRKKRLKWKRVGFSMLFIPIMLGSGPLAATFLWKLCNIMLPQMDENLAGHPQHTLVFFLGLVLITLALSGALVGWFVRKWSATYLTLALLVWGVILALFLTENAPGSQYPVTLPMLFMAPVLLLALMRNQTEEKGWQFAMIVAGIPALMLLLPLCYALFLALPVTWLLIPGGVLALSCSFSMVHGTWLLPYPRLLALTSMAAGLGCFLLGTLLNLPGTQSNPTLASLSYGIDHETGEAFWISSDSQPRGWAKPFLKNAQPRMPHFLPGIKSPFLYAKADGLPQPAPKVEVLADEQRENVRQLRLRLQSAIKAESLFLEFAPGSRILSFSIGGEAFHRLAEPLQITGIGEEGVVCDIEIPITSEVRLTLVEMKRGLPATAQRPPTSAPSLWLPNYQDVVLSLRRISL